MKKFRIKFTHFFKLDRFIKERSFWNGTEMVHLTKRVSKFYYRIELKCQVYFTLINCWSSLVCLVVLESLRGGVHLIHLVHLNNWHILYHIGFMGWDRECLLKGKDQYGWPPCTNKFSVFLTETILFFLIKQPRRSTILSHRLL